MTTQRPIQPLVFSKTGLVFSGGASKAAAFHVGVCLALRDKGFSFVGGLAEEPSTVNSNYYPRPKLHPFQIGTYVGSSAGALMVTMLASGIAIESIINSFTDDPTFKIPGNHKEIARITLKDMLSVNWPTPKAVFNSFRKISPIAKSMEGLVLRNIRIPGAFSTKGLAKYLKKNILPTEHFHHLQADLFIVGTQLDHSRKIIFGRYGTEKTFDEYCQYASNASISDAVAASMSLPPIFAPYLVNHGGDKTRYYIDGEIRETLSTHVARENGCDLTICSYTHQPYHFDKEFGSLYDYGLPAIMIQTVYQAIEQKIYNARRSNQSKQNVLHEVRDFFKKENLPEDLASKLVNHLATQMNYDEKQRTIYIHPDAKDKEMFFGDHFTLSPQVLQKVVAIGYRRAMSELRRYEFVPQI